MKELDTTSFGILEAESFTSHRFRRRGDIHKRHRDECDDYGDMIYIPEKKLLVMGCADGVGQSEMSNLGSVSAVIHGLKLITQLSGKKEWPDQPDHAFLERLLRTVYSKVAVNLHSMSSRNICFTGKSEIDRIVGALNLSLPVEQLNSNELNHIAMMTHRFGTIWNSHYHKFSTTYMLAVVGETFGGCVYVGDGHLALGSLPDGVRWKKDEELWQIKENLGKDNFTQTIWDEPKYLRLENTSSLAMMTDGFDRFEKQGPDVQSFAAAFTGEKLESASDATKLLTLPQPPDGDDETVVTMRRDTSAPAKEYKSLSLEYDASHRVINYQEGKYSSVKSVPLVFGVRQFMVSIIAEFDGAPYATSKACLIGMDDAINSLIAQNGENTKGCVMQVFDNLLTPFKKDINKTSAGGKELNLALIIQSEERADIYLSGEFQLSTETQTKIVSSREFGSFLTLNEGFVISPGLTPNTTDILLRALNKPLESDPVYMHEILQLQPEATFLAIQFLENKDDGMQANKPGSTDEFELAVFTPPRRQARTWSPPVSATRPVQTTKHSVEEPVEVEDAEDIEDIVFLPPKTGYTYDPEVARVRRERDLIKRSRAQQQKTSQNVIGKLFGK